MILNITLALIRAESRSMQKLREVYVQLLPIQDMTVFQKLENHDSIVKVKIWHLVYLYWLHLFVSVPFCQIFFYYSTFYTDILIISYSSSFASLYHLSLMHTSLLQFFCLRPKRMSICYSAFEVQDKKK